VGFLDIHTHSIRSSGTDSPLRMAAHARRLGIEIGLCDGPRGDGAGDVACHGTELRPSGSRELKRELMKRNPGFILVRAGSEALNRAAVGDKRVGALVDLGRNRTDAAISPVVARKAAETGVAVEVNLGLLASSRGFSRIRLIRGIKQTLELKRKFGFTIIAATGAQSHLDLRGWDTAAAILRALGFDDAEVDEALRDGPRAVAEGGQG